MAMPTRHGPPPGGPVDAHQSAHALGDLVHARSVAVRSVLTEARNAAHYNARIDSLQGLVVDAEPIFDGGPKILHHHVGVRCQAIEQLAAGGRLQVKEHRAFIAVQVFAIEVREAGIHTAQAGPRYLNDLGPEIGQNADGGRARASLAQIEDLDVTQRARVPRLTHRTRCEQFWSTRSMLRLQLPLRNAGGCWRMSRTSPPARPGWARSTRRVRADLRRGWPLAHISLVRRTSRGSSAGKGRPRCIVRRLSHMTRSPVERLYLPVPVQVGHVGEGCGQPEVVGVRQADTGAGAAGVFQLAEAAAEGQVLLVRQGLIVEHEHGVRVHSGVDRRRVLGRGWLTQIQALDFGGEARADLAGAERHGRLSPRVSDSVKPRRAVRHRRRTRAGCTAR